MKKLHPKEGKLIASLKGLLNKWTSKKILSILMIFSVVAVLTTIVLVKRKTLTVIIDGEALKVVTLQNTLGKALEKKKIPVGSKDKIEPSLEAKIADKDTIVIKRAVKVNIIVDGKEITLLSAEENIDTMLKAEGITVRAQDKVKPDAAAKLTDGMNIAVVRVEKKSFTDTVALDFKTTIKYDRGTANTKRRTTQEGHAGERQTITEVTYEDGVEVFREIVSETVTKSPVDKIIVQGTYPVMPISRGGDPVPYSRVIKSRATAYWAVRGIGKTYTASGRLAVRNPDGYSTIAVDPKVIPYGTRLFVENYGFAIAADTGTAIVGDKIDVYFDTYREACDWAVKYVNVYVLK